MTPKTNLKIFNTDFIKLQRLVWVLCAIYLPFNAHSIPIKVKSKASQGIKRFTVFNQQSKLRSQSNVGGFITIGTDASCYFDSAVDSLQTVIDSGATEIRVASNGIYQNNLTNKIIRGIKQCLT